MQERARQEILQAMGVAVLQPRFVFAGAKASKVLAAAPAAKPEQDDYRAKATAALEPAAKSSDDSQSKLPLKSLKDIVAIGNGPKEPEKTTVKASSLRYRHRVIACDSIIFVVDQPELEWQEAEKKLRFMQDICQALFAKPCAGFKQDTFSWPMAGIDDSHAKATEQAFIKGLAKQYQATCVVLFAKNLAPMLIDDGAINDLPAVAVEPVEHYWQHPLEKAKLWQSLQALR